MEKPLSIYMKIIEIINESLSRQVFHFTTAATEILTSGEFKLTSSFGNVEEEYALKGYPYFLSTTRTRHGGYHDKVGPYGALFVLDGNWFNSRYPSKPIDYFRDRNPQRSKRKPHEAEDRVFSKEPTMPIDGITAVHFYLDTSFLDYDWNASTKRALLRQGLIAAKKRGIPAYFYTDVNAWKNFDTRRQADISILLGKSPAKQRKRNNQPDSKELLLPWVELMQAKAKSQLSQRAIFKLDNINDPYAKHSLPLGLRIDLTTTKKHDSLDRNNVIKIINYMKQHKLTTVNDFINHLAEKWENL